MLKLFLANTDVLNSDSFERNSKTEVMASAVKDATNSMDIKLVVTLTKTGHTARFDF